MTEQEQLIALRIKSIVFCLCDCKSSQQIGAGIGAIMIIDIAFNPKEMSDELKNEISKAIYALSDMKAQAEEIERKAFMEAKRDYIARVDAEYKRLVSELRNGAAK